MLEAVTGQIGSRNDLVSKEALTKPVLNVPESGLATSTSKPPVRPLDVEESPLKPLLPTKPPSLPPPPPLLPIEPFPAKRKRRRPEESEDKKKSKTTKTNVSKEKVISSKKKEKSKMAKNIKNLERTIEELNEEIVRVADKIQEKNKLRMLESTTTTPTEDLKLATTTTKEISTYFPTKSKKAKSDKKIRIKIPQKKQTKESKPKIQPYEYPIIAETLTDRNSFYHEGGVESTTVIYAIPYKPEQEITTMKSF